MTDNTIATPPPSFSEPTPTEEGVEISEAEYDTIRRAAIAVLIRLHYAKYGKTPGYKAVVKIDWVKEKE